VNLGITVRLTVDACAPLPLFGLRHNLANWRKCGRKFKKKLGRLPFTPTGTPNVRYSTIGGPYCYHPQSVVYGPSIHNVADSLNRIDAARENEDALCHNNWRIAPGRNRALSRFLNSYYSKIRAKLEPELHELRDELEEQIVSAEDETHHKFQLRVRSMRGMLDNLSMRESLFMKRITHKVKVPETAKFGKGSRAIGDYTCPGSLLCPFLVTPLKHAFSERVEHDGCIIRFAASTEAEEIDDMITEMWHSTSNYFIYFSDDMICKVFREGVPEFYNLDISSCDKSNTRPVFERLRWFYAGKEWNGLIDRAISQCEQDLLIRNPENPDEWVTANVTTPTEFSGTLLTTLLNNIAASSICLSIHHLLKRTLVGSPHSTPTLIEQAAFAVGYKVTGERCSTPEDLQFLKMSFWMDDDGRLHSFLNLGPVVRSFGTCWMDYPYDTTQADTLPSAIRFRNWSVLQGYQHCADNELFQAYSMAPGCSKDIVSHRTALRISKGVTGDLLHKQWTSSTLRLPVPTTSLLLRYQMTGGEWAELCRLVRCSDVGDIIHCVAVYRILHRDYGYALPSFPGT
jgi:hypothetical protein